MILCSGHPATPWLIEGFCDRGWPTLNYIRYVLCAPHFISGIFKCNFFSSQFFLRPPMINSQVTPLYGITSTIETLKAWPMFIVYDMCTVGLACAIDCFARKIDSTCNRFLTFNNYFLVLKKIKIVPHAMYKLSVSPFFYLDQKLVQKIPTILS
jgi:hypothetical protein